MFDDRCDALAELWVAWARTTASITDDDWFAATRLPGWHVAALVAHHSRFPHALETLVTRRVDGPPTVESAVALLRRFNEPDGAATRLAGAVAEQGRSIAAATPTDDLVAAFRDGGPRAIDTMRATGDVVVDYFGHGRLPLAEVLLIAGLEATVHLLDLQRALGVEPDVPSAGLAQTAALLGAVADPVVFVEAATGRTDTNPLPVIR